jgi:hypothetical protein
LDADLDGTEVYEPLEWIFKQPDINGYLRQVFVVTDGQVYLKKQQLTFKKQLTFCIALGFECRSGYFFGPQT